jgi:hypothetical protein
MGGTLALHFSWWTICWTLSSLLTSLANLLQLILSWDLLQLQRCFLSSNEMIGRRFEMEGDVALVPWWLLLVMIVGDVTVTVVKVATSGLG